MVIKVGENVKDKHGHQILGEHDDSYRNSRLWVLGAKPHKKF